MTWRKVQGENAIVRDGKRVALSEVKDQSSGDHRVFLAEGYAEARVIIFKHRLDAQVQEKLREMVAYPVSMLASRQFSWPYDTVINADGETVGYFAGFIAGAVTLREAVSRNRQLPLWTRLAIAKNLCTALAAFHGTGMVFGVLTADTVWVDLATCRVYLDPGLNAQLVAYDGRVLFCDVGVPEFLPPEFHRLGFVGGTGVGANRPRFVCSDQSDAFALGVLIFALMNKGRHPFSSKSNKLADIADSGEWQLERIRNPMPIDAMLSASGRDFPGNWSWWGSPLRRYRAIPNYDLLRNRHYGLGLLYDRCFSHIGSKRRPDEFEWFSALEEASRTATARVSRLAAESASAIRSAPEEADTGADRATRRIIAEQFPADEVGIEMLASSSVFWRTTLLFALGVGLCLSASLSGWFHFALPLLVLACTLVAAFAANSLSRFKRGIRGYRPVHYAASFLCSVLAGLLASAGVWSMAVM